MNAHDAAPLIEEAELVVVGGGPAGSACAARAAERGLDVVVIDQGSFPREKACGDGLTRSSVAYLHQLGLDDLVSQSYEIEGARLVVSHRKRREKRYTERPGRPRWARCVSRRVLDTALLDAALERGARFIQGRVDAPYTVGRRVAGVELQTDAGRARVGAQVVIAADGATSRMRRKCALGSPNHMTATAIRQYATTEHELDPLFEIYVPVVSGADVLFGYGWVFPLGARLANVGIGVGRVPGLKQPPSLRVMLDAFVEQLQRPGGAPFGHLQLLGEPSGSPLAIDFSSSRCQFENILFTGDAARTVDPITGEGISYALHAGEIAADFAYGGLREGRSIDGVGLHLARRFPRLGQDLSPAARRSTLKLHGRFGPEGESTVKLKMTKREPLLYAVARMAATPKSDTRLSGMPILELLEREDTALAEALLDLSEKMLDAVNTEFPLVSEVLHRKFRARFGPMLAATLLLSSSATGGCPSDLTTSAALACELTRLAHITLGQVGQDSQSSLGHTNAAMAILFGDFCITRAVDLATLTNQSVMQSLMAVNRDLCVGGLLEVHDLFDLKRTPRRYFEVAEKRTAALFGLSASLGAELAGASQATVESVRRYGRALGVATQIANDVLDLTARDEIGGTSAGTDLRSGIYTLPVIYSLEADPKVRRLLAGRSDTDDLPAVLHAINASGGIERARGVCRDRLTEARRALAGAVGIRQAPLEGLAELVLECLGESNSSALSGPWSVRGDAIYAQRVQLSDLREA